MHAPAENARVVPSSRHRTYGAVSGAQKTVVPHTQNKILHNGYYESFSKETSQRIFERNERKTAIMRFVAMLVALALLLAVASGAVWGGDHGFVVPKLSLRQQLDVDATRPIQIHLALYDNTAIHDAKQVGMVVSWATAKPTVQSIVRFGRTPGELSGVATASEPCQQYTFCNYTSPFLHHVVIDGRLLESDTTYFCELPRLMLGTALEADGFLCV
jgi:hypothetical protein